MMKKNSGSILIVSLWVLVILSLLVLGLSHKARLEAQLVRYHWNDIALTHMAKQAVKICSQILIRNRTGFSALNQTWSHDEEAFHAVPFAPGEYTVQSDDADAAGRTLYGMTDEERRININTASEAVLLRLFENKSDIVAAILDWRDTDHIRRSDGAEKDEYADKAYTCRNGPFQSSEELLLVRGVTPDVYAHVKEWFTVYGTGHININTAGVKVLMLAGVSESLAQKIIAYRRGADGMAGTEDDNVFRSLGSLQKSFAEDVDLSADEALRLHEIVNARFYTVKSDVFRLNLTTQAGESGPQKRFSIIVKQGFSYQWRENVS